MELNAQEKWEIKTMIANEMVVLSKALIETSNRIHACEEIDDDFEDCYQELRVYKRLEYLGLHLYDKDRITYTAKDFWNNDTSVRDGVWDALEQNLTPELFKKVRNYLLEKNK